jgi:hypothetical protein
MTPGTRRSIRTRRAARRGGMGEGWRHETRALAGPRRPPKNCRLTRRPASRNASRRPTSTGRIASYRAHWRKHIPAKPSGDKNRSCPEVLVTPFQWRRALDGAFEAMPARAYNKVTALQSRIVFDCPTEVSGRAESSTYEFRKVTHAL